MLKWIIFIFKGHVCHLSVLTLNRFGIICKMLFKTLLHWLHIKMFPANYSISFQSKQKVTIPAVQSFYFNATQCHIPCNWFMESIQLAFLSVSTTAMKKIHKHRYPITLCSYLPLTHEGSYNICVCVRECNSVWSLTWMPLSVSPLSALHPGHGYEPETSSEPHPTPFQRNPSHPPHSYRTNRNCVRER